LKEVQQQLQDSLKDKEAVLKQSKKELNAERESFGNKREELKKKIEDEQTKVKNTQQDLNEEERQFDKAKRNLEAQITEVQKTVKRLQSKMLREQQKFENDRVPLEICIWQESEEVADIEAELATKHDSFTKDKEQIERQLSEEVRLGKLKKRQMNERYNEIWSEMRARWESSKRDARKEGARLQEKYEKKFYAVQQRVVGLEDDLEVSKRTSAELNLMLDEIYVSRVLRWKLRLGFPLANQPFTIREVSP
jgi:chromosome segregation ATPase